MESNFTDLKHKDLIKQIEGLKKYTDCSMPCNEKQLIEKAECLEYNQAIADVIKLFSRHNLVWRSEPCGLLHSTDWNGKCFECGQQVFIREPK
jgi:hypothetical protein